MTDLLTVPSEDNLTETVVPKVKQSIFTNRRKCFATHINGYLNVDKTLTPNEKNHLNIIAKELDKLGSSAFSLTWEELSDKLSYEYQDIKVFFEIPIIKEYLREYELHLLSTSFRKILNKAQTERLTREDIAQLTALPKQLDKYLSNKDQFRFILLDTNA